MENGRRLLDIGLKPHSNGVNFSISTIDFLLIMSSINIINKIIVKIIAVCKKVK